MAKDGGDTGAGPERGGRISVPWAGTQATGRAGGGARVWAQRRGPVTAAQGTRDRGGAARAPGPALRPLLLPAARPGLLCDRRLTLLSFLGLGVCWLLSGD